MTAPPLEFAVYGLPAPQGSKRAVGRDGKGRAILVESSRRVKPWRELVWAAGLEARACRPPLDGPLVASLVFTLPRPKSAPKRRRWPDGKPDLGKLARAVEDALSNAGVWADDARVVGYAELWKCWPGEHPRSLEAPGAWVRVQTLEDYETARAGAGQEG